jgi:HSP20 family protein
VDPPRASPKPWVRQQYLADRWPFGLGWGRMITDFLDSDFFTDPFYDVPPVRSQQPSDGKQQAGPLSLWGNSSTLPSVDVVEREKDYILQVDLPGVKRADIKVTVDDRHGDKILTVSGERRENMHEDDKAKGFRTWSRSYGSFSRSLALPKHVDSHGITAKHEDGVLKVTIPKLAIAPQPVKEIAVQH